MLQYTVITPPVDDPVTLDETKMHLRLTDADMTGELSEQDLLLSLITAAREYCELYMGRALGTQTLEAFSDAFPCRNEIELPMPPLQSVTNVKYTDSSGAENTLMPDVDYLIDTGSTVGRIVLPYGKTWPHFTPCTVNPIKIRYVAGYTETPKPIKQAMLLLIGHWYANREATGTAAGQIEFAVQALLGMYKVRWF